MDHICYAYNGATLTSLENLEQLEISKSEYNCIHENLSQGSIVQNRAKCYEKREKSNKYFFKLESHNKTLKLSAQGVQ